MRVTYRHIVSDDAAATLDCRLESLLPLAVLTFSQKDIRETSFQAAADGACGVNDA